MRILVFDTETTGLEPSENQIAQLSYVILNQDYNIEVAKNFYFAVDYVEEGASQVTGLTKESLEKLSNGKIFKDHSEEIYKDFLNADILVAHNISFDMAFMRKEFENVGLDVDTLFKDKETFCTMNKYTYVLQIPHNFYGVKYPTLNETMDYLNVSFDLIQNKMNKVFKLERLDEGFYHDARFDVIATMYAYILYERTDGIEVYKKISKIIDKIKHTSNKLIDLQEYFNNSFFGEEFDKEFCNDNIFEDNSNSLILDIENSLKRLKNKIERIESILNEERARIKRKRDLEIKEYIDSKLEDKDEFELIKAVYYCSDFNRCISLNEQLLNDTYEQNVDLIELEENTYLMIMKDELMNIIKVNSDQQDYKENMYEVLECKECPSIYFDDRNVIVKSYNTKLGCTPRRNVSDDDDEIPF